MFAVCGSGNAVTSVVNAVRATASLREIAADSIRIGYDESGYHVASVARGPIGSVAAPLDSRRVCPWIPPATHRVLVSQGGVLPGESVAAIAAVLAYRTLHPWPLIGPAHADGADTSIGFQRRARFGYVEIIDFKTTGCGAEERYRVDPVTFDVRPFDGCLEPHAGVRSLPSLRRLPQ